jgi:hypothetical protein
VHVRGGGTGRVNLAGPVCYRPGQRSRLIYRVRPYRGRKNEPKALTCTGYQDLLVAAHQQLKAPIVLVWDNLNVHKTPQMREFIAEHADWLPVFHLPTYAPELNPAEGIWSMIKASLVNFTARNLNHLIKTVKRRLKMIQYRPSVVDGCLTQTGLIMQPP